MTLTIQSSSDQMAVSRMFGRINPDSYSPEEYARTLSPIIESRLRVGPIRITNSYLEPHNRGVSLTLTCERTYRVCPRPRADVNTVLLETGQPTSTDYNAFVESLFQLGEKLRDITLVDCLGNSQTFSRGQLPASSADSLCETLDLSDLQTESPVQEDADWLAAADKLLASSDDNTQEGLGYRAYLRQVISKNDPAYLTKSEDAEIREGALKARKDLIDLAGTLTT